MKIRGDILRAALSSLAIFLPNLPALAEVAVRDGEKVVFLGDSITRLGGSSPDGYVRLVVAGLETAGIRVTPIPAGIAGNRSSDMLARTDRVLSKKPDWLLLSCGVNDVCFGLSGTNGIALDPFKANITSIVNKAQSGGVKVMLLTASPIGEEKKTPGNRALAPYNDFLRALAKEKNIPLADVNSAMQDVLKNSATRGRVLTVDGLHLNAAGNRIFALCILRAFGFDEGQIRKAQAGWPASVSK